MTVLGNAPPGYRLTNDPADPRQKLACEMLLPNHASPTCWSPSPPSSAEPVAPAGWRLMTVHCARANDAIDTAPIATAQNKRRRFSNAAQARLCILSMSLAFRWPPRRWARGWIRRIKAEVRASYQNPAKRPKTPTRLLSQRLVPSKKRTCHQCRQTVASIRDLG